MMETRRQAPLVGLMVEALAFRRGKQIIVKGRALAPDSQR